MSEKKDNRESQSAVATLRLDTGHLQSISMLYPEAMREAVMWLGGYLATGCNRSLSMLESKVQRLGFETTGSTISKVLRGRWETDARGRKLPSPCIAVPNFLQIVEKLRSEVRLDQLAGKVPFIKTPTAQRIYNYIDRARSPKRVCKFGLIIGPTGAQKTETLKNYQIENNHGAVVWLESPARPSLTQFISDLAATYGIARTDKSSVKMNKLLADINSARCVIVDNIQRLYIEGDGDIQPILNFLQYLQDTTGCTIILCATPTFGLTMRTTMAAGFFEQFEGRCGGRRNFLELPAFAPREDILAIAEAFDLVDAKKHVTELEKISREPGRIRILFNTLQTARQDADDEGEPLTIDHIRTAIGDEREGA